MNKIPCATLDTILGFCTDLGLDSMRIKFGQDTLNVYGLHPGHVAMFDIDAPMPGADGGEVAVEPAWLAAAVKKFDSKQDIEIFSDDENRLCLKQGRRISRTSALDPRNLGDPKRPNLNMTFKATLDGPDFKDAILACSIVSEKDMHPIRFDWADGEVLVWSRDEIRAMETTVPASFEGSVSNVYAKDILSKLIKRVQSGPVEYTSFEDGPCRIAFKVGECSVTLTVAPLILSEGE